ncbi:MAG TPA: hypothetical protein VK625_18290, partial [Flavitalea sp.]|nr:hypothetical protein [Flavitalea sp.]
MALDERYIVASDLEQYFVDKDSGLPLAAGTLTFYRDTARNVPKTVYQLSGSPPNYTYTAMPNPITLSSVGTVQNAGGDNEVIYYFPFDNEGNLDLYYVVCRNSDGVEQFSREAWPNITSANDPTRDLFPIQNQISNPQFTEVLINEGVSTTYTVSAATNQVFEFAPNWDFVISGTGTVTIQRVAITGNENVVTSPPYVLDITVSVGITACYLRQRFTYNSGLWASTDDESIFLSGTLIARNEGSGTTGLQMLYAESSGGTPIVIIDESFDNSGYQTLSGSTASAIPLSTNTDTGEDGFIDIYLSFLPSTHVRVSSIQVVPTISDAGADLIQYDPNSSNREEALMGDYFLPRLKDKQIPSLITGWDFPLNPFQFGSSGNIGATGAYICDQTIAARGATGNVAFARNSITTGLQFTTAGTNDAFYILQYLTGAQAKKIIGTRLSANVFGYKSSAGNAVTMRVYLYRGSSSATIPTLGTTIGTLSTSGEFTLTASNWTEISRSGLDTAKATLNTVATNPAINDRDNDYGFSGWEITDSTQIGNTDKFAIVVTFGYADASTVITVNSVSVVPGDIPCRPALQTSGEVLIECQYYWEKSYAVGTTAGTATFVNANYSPMSSNYTNASANPSVLEILFNTEKRSATPNLVVYNPATGTSNNVVVNAFARSGSGNTNATANVAFSSNWTLVS